MSQPSSEIKGRSSRHSRSLPSAFVTIALSAILALSAYAFLADSFAEPKNDDVPAPPASDTLDMGNGQRPVSALVTLTRRGFEPREATVRAGRLMLMVDNRSEMGQMELELDRVDGSRSVSIPLKESPRDQGEGQRRVLIPRERLTWGNVLDLSEGRYVLRESNHSEWSFRINVTR